MNKFYHQALLWECKLQILSWTNFQYSMFICLSKAKNTTYLFFPSILVSHDVENGVAMAQTTSVLFKASEVAIFTPLTVYLLSAQWPGLWMAARLVVMLNRPFPSSLVPLFQSESKCKTIVMKMTLICIRMKLHAELIFIWKVSHLDSFWDRGTRELGNGLLCQRFQKISVANGKVRFVFFWPEYSRLLLEVVHLYAAPFLTNRFSCPNYRIRKRNEKW